VVKSKTTVPLNETLQSHIDRLARLNALGHLIDGWDIKFGLVSEEASEAAAPAFDLLEAATNE
jgi:hypothetical protein